MKNRYRIYIREKFSGGKVWWIQDNQTNKRESLGTKDKAEANRLLDLKNQPHHFTGFHVQMARTHLLVSDPQSSTRTWQNVMDAIVRQKKGSTKTRWERAAKSKALDSIRNLVVANTKADEFLAVLGNEKVSTNVYLRRLHNFAMDMNWLLAPVIAKRAWPKVEYGEKRAITLAEHRQIVEREKNLERKAFYEVCWHVGASQTDIANLKGENIDWNNRTISFDRKKTGQNSKLAFGSSLPVETCFRILPLSASQTAPQNSNSVALVWAFQGLRSTATDIHGQKVLRRLDTLKDTRKQHLDTAAKPFPALMPNTAVE